MESNLIALGH